MNQSDSVVWSGRIFSQKKHAKVIGTDGKTMGKYGGKHRGNDGIVIGWRSSLVTWWEHMWNSAPKRGFVRWEIMDDTGGSQLWEPINTWEIEIFHHQLKDTSYVTHLDRKTCWIIVVNHSGSKPQQTMGYGLPATLGDYVRLHWLI